jgi:dihydropyrimidine dehydrogenase (NAD+) subunit PreT
MSKVIKLDYQEQHVQDYNLRTAMEEASRCLLCEDAPCSQDCPAKTDPGSFIRSIRFKNPKGAAETIRKNNILGASCALVCPYDKLCEKACGRTGIDVPIKIGKLQKFAMNQEKLFGMKILEAPTDKKKAKIACIGAGPASLSCAAKLASEGYKVTIFEEKEKAGGVLTYGITPSRLPQEVVDQDINAVKELGVQFVMNKRIAKNQLEELKKEYNAIFVGVGLGKSKEVNIPGIELNGVTTALEFLAKAKDSKGNMELESNIIIIGGGDVALDCATTSHQLSKGKTTIIYRRSIEEAPANIDELVYAQSMGIPIITEFAPNEILGNKGKVVGLKCKSRDGYSEMKIRADIIILAIGQEPSADYKNFTSKNGLFASGDFTNGGKSVVQAVAEGKESAQQIMEYLNK